VPFGWIGVQIFFVLSGFVIANSADGTNWLRFIRNRFLRLYPAAWVCALIAVIPMTMAQAGSDPVGAMFVHSLILGAGGPYLATAYWTLPIELAFYATVALLLFFGQFRRLEQLGCGLVAVSTVYIVLLCFSTFGLIRIGDISFGYGRLNMTLLRHGVFFALGIFLYLRVNGRLGRAANSLVIPAVIASLCEIACRAAEVTPKYADPLGLAYIFGAAVLGYSLSLAVLWFSVSRWMPKLGYDGLFVGVLRTLGLASYPFYLLHEAVGLPILSHLARHGFSAAVGVLIAFVSASCLALVVAAWLERGMRDLTAAVLVGCGNLVPGTRAVLARLSVPGGIKIFRLVGVPEGAS
jgi:peptidoglycan/LPS O-acetylase OafA/YrhL